MQRVLTAEEMRLADKFNIESLGIPEDVLVERAGFAVAEEIFSRFKGGRVLVLIGKGNNGADGKVIANLLSARHGFSVTAFDVFTGDLTILDNDFDLVVDCIFGTGLSREISGKIKDIIDKVNGMNKFVVSCDIPSGISGTTGKVLGTAIKANLTVAIGELKTGHFFNDGKEYSGKVIQKDIGISVWGDGYPLVFNDDDIREFFPKRKENSHKGNYGKVAVIGGSKTFVGAPLLSLSALNAYRAGVGYSYLVVPKSLYSVYAGLNPECVFMTLDDDGENFILDKENLSKLFNLDAISFGTGVGVTSGVYDTLKFIIENYTGKLVIDADGLNVLSAFGTDVLLNKKCEIVLTPHIKEFSRLTNKSVQEIIDNPIALTKEMALKYGVTVLLKSATSVISNGEETFINATGSPALAKAGSGDVLTGLITGLLATNSPLLATAVGAYIFGRAGEITAKEVSEYSSTATEVSKNIGKAILSVL